MRGAGYVLSPHRVPLVGYTDEVVLGQQGLNGGGGVWGVEDEGDGEWGDSRRGMRYAGVRSLKEFSTRERQGTPR